MSSINFFAQFVSGLVQVSRFSLLFENFVHTESAVF